MPTRRRDRQQIKHDPALRRQLPFAKAMTRFHEVKSSGELDGKKPGTQTVRADALRRRARPIEAQAAGLRPPRTAPRQSLARTSSRTPRRTPGRGAWQKPRRTDRRSNTSRRVATDKDASSKSSTRVMRSSVLEDYPPAGCSEIASPSKDELARGFKRWKTSCPKTSPAEPRRSGSTSWPRKVATSEKAALAATDKAAAAVAEKADARVATADPSRHRRCAPARPRCARHGRATSIRPASSYRSTRSTTSTTIPSACSDQYVAALRSGYRRGDRKGRSRSSTSKSKTAAGRFPEELIGRMWNASMIGDDEEYWPFQGEFWADEYEGFR